MTYWADLDAGLERLVRDGFCYLPPVRDVFPLAEIYGRCAKEMGGRTYAENLDVHLAFAHEAGIIPELSSALYALAQSHFGYRGREDDRYHVTRLVRPGDLSEGYRGHFDSHIFTLVVPIQIPDGNDMESSGELIFYPALRAEPKSEFSNFAGKLYYKKFASESGFEKLARKNKQVIADFKDARPLLFLGRQTLHGNRPVSDVLESPRLTLLSHFFDPSPAWGVGNILRKFRCR